MSITTIILIVLALLIIWVIASYNRFVRLINRAKEAWADIDVQLKRRHDLIPNLVNTVKGYATHETSAFENVTKARAAALGAKTPAEAGAAENMLTRALGGIFAIAEAYPQLQANENFLELQRELSDTENKVQASRRFYNANVRDLNTSVESFPGNVIAGAFHFRKMDLFDLTGDESARSVPEVKF